MMSTAYKKQGRDKSAKGDRRLGTQQKITKKKKPTLKNQIRGINRLLQKEGLIKPIKTKLETELLTLQQQLKLKQQQELERKYAIRYHRIRFFERVKLEREIKKLSKDIAENGSTLEKEAALKQLKDNLMYVMHFPRGEKYVSLLRNASDPEAQAHLDAERARLRALVLASRAQEAAITEADEGARLLQAEGVDVTKPDVVAKIIGTKTPKVQGPRAGPSVKAKVDISTKTKKSASTVPSARRADEPDNANQNLDNSAEEHVRSDDSKKIKGGDQKGAPVVASKSSKASMQGQANGKGLGRGGLREDDATAGMGAAVFNDDDEGDAFFMDVGDDEEGEEGGKKGVEMDLQDEAEGAHTQRGRQAPDNGAPSSSFPHSEARGEAVKPRRADGFHRHEMDNQFSKKPKVDFQNSRTQPDGDTSKKRKFDKQVGAKSNSEDLSRGLKLSDEHQRHEHVPGHMPKASTSLKFGNGQRRTADEPYHAAQGEQSKAKHAPSSDRDESSHKFRPPGAGAPRDSWKAPAGQKPRPDHKFASTKADVKHQAGFSSPDARGATVKPPDQPLRSRAEGGRKRRKKK